MFLNTRIKKILKTSDYGVYYNYLTNDYFQKPIGKDFEVKRKFFKIHSPSKGLLMSLVIKNKSKSTKHINSIVIADFKLPRKLGLPNEYLINEWTQSGSCKKVKSFIKTEKSDFIMMRDQNPYSFMEEFGYLGDSMISEWFSSIDLDKLNFFLGAVTTSQQYTQIFYKLENGQLRIRITCQLDGVELEPEKKVNSEKILILWGESQNLQNIFAKEVARHSKVHNVEREINGICCAYYAQGNRVNEKYVMNTLLKIDEKNNSGQTVNTDTLLIDAGYCEFGDWLEYKEQFPKGMKNIAREIRSRGLKAGIWIAPVIASINSQLYQNHKNWFIEGFEGRKTQPFDFIDSLSLMILDPTLNEVKDYLRSVFKQYYDWGFRVFKIDFVYPIGFTTDFSRNVTRAQALTGLLDVIRLSVGKDAVFLSAISQLSPLVGKVDFVRTGIDTTSPLVYRIPILRGRVNNFMLKKNIESFKHRQFLDKKVWNADIDCLVLNENAKLDEKLVLEQAVLMEHSNSKWLGDDMTELTEGRILYMLV